MVTSYLSEAEVEAGLGMTISATSVIITSTQLTEVLNRTTTLINAFLNTSTNLTGAGEEICKTVQLDLVLMHLMRLRKMKETNLTIQSSIMKTGTVGESFQEASNSLDVFSIPTLTMEHKTILTPYQTPPWVCTGYTNYSK